MRKVLIWSVRALGALLVVAFLFAAAAGAWVYGRAASELPDHRLADGASTWQGCIPPEVRRAEVVPLSAMPANAINAFLAAEEPDFLTREPYNPLTDVLRRLWRRKYYRPSISVVYVHLLFCLNNPAGVRPPRSINRSIKESLLHYRIERDLPRRNILETVINTVYFGNGAYGMPSAALRYFKRPLTELSTGELAFLGGMYGTQHVIWGIRYGDALKVRKTVLDRMVGMGVLTAEQAAAAKLEPLAVDFLDLSNA